MIRQQGVKTATSSLEVLLETLLVADLKHKAHINYNQAIKMLYESGIKRVIRSDDIAWLHVVDGETYPT